MFKRKKGSRKQRKFLGRKIPMAQSPGQFGSIQNFPIPKVQDTNLNRPPRLVYSTKPKQPDEVDYAHQRPFQDSVESEQGAVRVRSDKNIERCLAPNCGNEITGNYWGLPVCPSGDCRARYLSKQAEEDRLKSYLLSKKQKELITANRLGRGFDSIHQLAQACS